MDTLKELKETAEVRIYKQAEEVRKLAEFYGIPQVKKAFELLMEARNDLLLDLDEINKEEKEA